MTRAVFLDRDGVLNAIRYEGETPASPRTSDEFHVLPFAGAAVQVLRALGFVVVVITNQPDLARGKLNWTDLDAMHRKLFDEVEIDRIEVCPHSGHEGCDCRKPRPGMINRAADDVGIDLASSWTIGDRWVDIAAGKAAGTRTLLVEYAHSWSANSSGVPHASLRPNGVVADLNEAAITIATNESGR
jgi:D-glycero-D-manno-heptose 1,7-bisphosphate phosphatase